MAEVSYKSTAVPEWGARLLRRTCLVCKGPLYSGMGYFCGDECEQIDRALWELRRMSIDD